MIKISGREVTYAQFVNDVAKAVASELHGKQSRLLFNADTLLKCYTQI